MSTEALTQTLRITQKQTVADDIAVFELRRADGGERGRADVMRLGDEGDHGPMVPRVERGIEHAAVGGSDRGADGVDHGRIAAFGKVRNALDQRHVSRQAMVASSQACMAGLPAT